MRGVKGTAVGAAERDRRWRKRHPKRHAARQRKWTARNGNGYAVTKKYRKAHPEKFKQQARARLLKKYGLTPAQYDVMLAMGNGACWVCKKKYRKDGKLLKLYVEHDHKTDRVRGLACYRCNRYVIGRHRNGKLFRAAADYLDSTFDAREIAA